MRAYHLREANATQETELTLDHGSRLQQPQKRDQKNYMQLIEYVVEFSHLMPNNLSEAALGGRTAQMMSWTLELEPFSTFSYSVMRNNVFSICVEDQYAEIRKSIIDLKPPKLAQ